LGFEFPIKLNYFISPMGLVVLGYYLRYTERSILNNQYFALFLMLFGFVANFILSYLYATPTEFYEFGQYSIFTTIAVIGLFLLFKNFSKFNINLNFISNPNGIFKKFNFLISKNSYGMYLCHSFILAMIYNLINIYFPASPYYYRVVVIFVLTVLLSCGIVELLGRIPGLDKIAGSK
ncbi:MAG: acyltransferase family protein, partial [Methanobrevibacter sp.]|nr:acyltransferase family protein [Methanobrevibacter sp.]